MKRINIEKIKFSDLMQSGKFILPNFQRDYSWDDENLEEFIQSIISFICIKNKELNQLNINNEKYFSGDIILQEDKNDVFRIIDGQQRLVTLFILLCVIQEKIGNIKSYKDDIEEIFFIKSLEGQKDVRITLNNQKDDYEFKKALDIKTKQKVRGRGGNISNAKKFFTKFLKEEEKDDWSINDICEVILKNFYFALVKIGENDRVEELFTALNNTGLNLSNSDLLKALLITKIKESKVEKNKDEVTQKWEEKIVKVITEPGKKRQTINREIDSFLIDFWWAKYWRNKNLNDSSKIVEKPSKLNIYSLFKSKIEKKGDSVDNSHEVLNLLCNYAEVYKNIENPKYSWWLNKKSWPICFFYLVNDISKLGYSQLFPIILKMYFEFENSPNKEKESLMNELETILLFVFRWVTIKGKSPGDIRRITPYILNEISHKRRLISDNLKNDWFDEEFSDEGSKDFYNQLKTKSISKKEVVWEFVLKRYYWRKFQNEIGYHEGEKLNIKFIITKNNNDSESDIIHSLGNAFLMKGDIDFIFSDKPWKERKIKIKEIDERLLLSLEEDSLFDIDYVDENDILNRSKKLVEEFNDKMNLFDTSREFRNYQKFS